MRWWKVGADPVKLTAPLRGVASVITGNVAAARAKPDGAERSLAIAKEAALLSETKSDEALLSLGLLVCAEGLHRKFPLGSGNWGEFLEYINLSSK